MMLVALGCGPTETPRSPTKSKAPSKAPPQMTLAASIVWQVDAPEDIRTLAVTSDGVVVVTIDGALGHEVIAYDNGHELWRRPGRDAVVAGSLVISRNKNQIIARAPRSGATVWLAKPKQKIARMSRIHGTEAPLVETANGKRMQLALANCAAKKSNCLTREGDTVMAPATPKLPFARVGDLLINENGWRAALCDVSRSGPSLCLAAPTGTVDALEIAPLLSDLSRLPRQSWATANGRFVATAIGRDAAGTPLLTLLRIADPTQQVDSPAPIH